MNDVGHPIARVSDVCVGPLHENAGGFQFDLLDASGKRLVSFAFTHAEEAERARAGLSEIADMAQVSTRPPALPAQSPARPPLSDERAQTWRQRTYTLLEEGMMESRAGRIIEGLLVALIVANVVAVALETIPWMYAQFHAAFAAFEQFSLVAYTIEYVLRIWASVEDPRVGVRGAIRGRLAFALRPLMIVDFLSFAPSYLGIVFGIDLRVLRIFRLFRLLKLARYSQALQALLGVLLAERNALFASVLLLLSVMCLEGELMHIAEGNIQPRTLGTLPGAMYWALTTLTTVGYGDITPATALGKLIASTTMVTGLALFALPVGIIANGFVTGLSRRRFAVSWNILRRQPLLQDLDVSALNEIIETATAALVKEHAQITLAGKEALEFHLIIAGTARAEGQGGANELGPGEMIGAEALHHSAVYRQTVTAVTEMRVLAMHGDELRRLVRKYPILHERIVQSAGLVDSAANDPALRLNQLEAENAQLRQLLVDGLLQSAARA